MQVILTQDVKGKGKAGELVKVNDGYARNYLLPRGLAVEANRGNVEAAKQQASAALHKKAKEKDAARQLAESMQDIEVKITVRCGEGGKLFGSVTSKEIAEQIKAQHGVEVEKKKIDLSEPIKAVGEYTATAKLYAGISTQLKVIVTAE